MSEGKPVQILSAEKDTFHLDEEALKAILLNEKIRDKKVVIIAIAGEMRRGKSFMLNFFLRYLESEDKSNWLGDENTELKGFSWRIGPKCDTSGILMWSKPYIIKNKAGEEYAVLLMDSQGTFDNDSSMKKCAMIFAMSTLISSMLIFNINQLIHEHQLQFLRFFVTYGKLATDLNENMQDKPFQHIQFLLRDWQCDYLHPYGYNGGKDYVDEILKLDKTKQHEDVYKLREYIRDVFTRIDCCLLPYPGKKVTSSKDFVGKTSDIDPEFVEQLKLYVPRVLSPEHLMPKSISGQDITSMELLEFFKAYFNVFNGNEMPEAKDLFIASAEASYLATYNKCKLFYKQEMSKLVTQESKHMKDDKLLMAHERISISTIEKFKSSRKFGGAEYEGEYVPKLAQDLHEMVNEYVLLNQAKENNTKAIRTALVLGAIWFVLYLLQGICSFIGLQTASNGASLMIYCLITLVLIWLGSIVMQGDKMRDRVETTANIVYDELMCPMTRVAVNYMVSNARMPQLDTR